MAVERCLERRHDPIPFDPIRSALLCMTGTHPVPSNHQGGQICMFEDSMCLKDVITFDQSARTRYQNYNKTPSSKTHTPPRKSHRIPSPKTPNSPHQKTTCLAKRKMLLCICSLKKRRKCIIEKEDQKGRDNKDRTSPKKLPNTF
jgi:hypothetical protein